MTDIVRNFSGMIPPMLLAIVAVGNAQNQEGGTMIELPQPDTHSDTSLEKAIAERRSAREFKDKSLSRKNLGQLLWAAQGVTDKSTGLRAAPSAGATYPLETYVVSESGVFQYHPAKHAIERLAERDKRAELAKAALGQRWVARAAVNIVFAAVFQRTTARYGERGRQYVVMEAGHAAENVLLQAVSLGLGAVPIGAFRDQAVTDVLNLPDKQHPLYIVPVGAPASQ